MPGAEVFNLNRLHYKPITMKHYHILFCFLFVTFASSYNTAKSQVDISDSLALVDLYNSTNGPGWILNIGWLTTEPGEVKRIVIMH